MIYNLLKPLIFKLDAEDAHNKMESTIKKINKSSFLISLISRIFTKKDDILKNSVNGITFQNPVGLGAGFDKNAVMAPTLQSLGFGFLELGTITPKPQIGNDKPRVKRFVKEKCVQNAFGFNNDGMDEIYDRVVSNNISNLPIGINIGKNKLTSEDDALNDYSILLDKFKDIADYFVINISSPNTPGLRDLQNEEFISSIFNLVKEKKIKKPVFLKIAPDMSQEDALNLVEIAINSGASGMILANTTIDYDSFGKELLQSEGLGLRGGISGEILKDKSFELLKVIAERFFEETTLISVGGISSSEEAYRRICYGASLVQVLTPLIFEGPSLVKKINIGLVELLKKDGFTNISQAIGSKLN